MFASAGGYNGAMSDPLNPLVEVAGDASALDHAREFVDLVSGKAPALYRELLQDGEFDGLLADSSHFGHGQLYVLAEFRVFSEEFERRFPDAGRVPCMNAFCSLFMKNDISLANLLEVAEEFAGKD